MIPAKVAQDPELRRLLAVLVEADEAVDDALTEHAHTEARSQLAEDARQVVKRLRALGVTT